MRRWHPGEHGYIIVSNRQVREIQVLTVSAGFCSVCYSCGGIRPGAIRLRTSRLFRTSGEALASIQAAPSNCPEHVPLQNTPWSLTAPTIDR